MRGVFYMNKVLKYGLIIFMIFYLILFVDFFVDVLNNHFYLINYLEWVFVENPLGYVLAFLGYIPWN
jgi:hypothetical protein